jgi:hypothetical protein
MNYNVTFYKNELEMLTERKANFVNNLKKLTSQVVAKLAKKMAEEMGRQEKTSGLTIFEFLKTMALNGEKVWRGGITLDDYTNLEIPYLPNTGKPIPFKFKYICNGTNEFSKFDAKGHCLHQVIRGKKLIAEIYQEMTFSINPDGNPNSTVKELINEIQHNLVHELAHAQDEYVADELASYKTKSNTSDEDIRFIEYWLKPTEIRSHFNEMIQIISSKKHHSPERTFRNMWKTHDKAKEIGYEGDEWGDTERTVYGMMKKKQQSTTVDEKSKDALMTVLNRAFRGNCPKLLANFIYTYHIAFVRDFSTKMKERYYDKFFPNTDVPSLEQMQEFYEVIKNITRGITKLKKEITDTVVKRGKARGYFSDEDREIVNEFNDLYNNLWKNDTLKSAFDSYNPKILKKLGKQMIESFREKHGYMTKGMMSKAAKAYTKQLEKDFREKYGSGAEGMEDFFNSTPPTR